MGYSDYYSNDDAPPNMLQFGDEVQEHAHEVVYQDDFQYENSSGHTMAPPRLRNSRKRRRRCVAGIAALLVVVAGVLAVVMVTRSSGGDSDPSNAASSVGTSSESTSAPPADQQEEEFHEPKPADEITDQEEILRSFSRHGGIEFDDPESYQSKALKWLLESQQTFSTSSGGQISEIDRMFQRFSLACIYFATNKIQNGYTDQTFGEYGMFPWNNEQGWLKDQDECTWYGITCDDEGFVTEIDLNTNSLTGTFPYEVSYLKDGLKALHLDKNFFHNQGDEGLAFVPKLKELRIFRARDGYIQYEGFPPQFGYLENLQQLDLSYNVLYGPLTEDMFQDVSVNQPLPELLFLDISGNSFRSSIPDALASLPNLQYFYAMNSFVHGDFSFVNSMPKPTEIWMDYNPDLTGGVPSLLSLKNSTLKSFSATHCALTGSIPSNIGDLTLMKQLWLSHNSLTGPIPSSLGKMPELIKLELDDNGLTGSVPDDVCAIHHPFGALRDLKVDCGLPCTCCDCCGDSCSRRRDRRILQHKQPLTL